MKYFNLQELIRENFKPQHLEVIQNDASKSNFTN